VILTSDGAAAWKVLQQPDHPLLAILDWSMPSMSGVEVCQEVRQRKDARYIYIILLTGRAETKDRILGLYAGADDYLTKPFDINDLEVRVRTAQRILELQDRLLAIGEEMRRQALHDELTGLHNRRAIDEILEREVSRAQRSGSSLGLVLCDIDNFKRINDSFGHQVGDSVIREIGKRMKAVLRPYDVIGRYGGEEYIVILPDADLRLAQEIAERLRIAVYEHKLEPSTGGIRVAISLGVTALAKGDTPDLERLIRAADTALYRAKEAGRNRVECEVLASEAPDRS
jgi:diguanylate cyclase (GGDEF)-like protein